MHPTFKCLMRHVSNLLQKHEWSDLETPGDTDIMQLLQQRPHALQGLYWRLWGHLDIRQLCGWPLIVHAYCERKFTFNDMCERQFAFVTWTQACGRDADANNPGAGDADILLATCLSQLIVEIGEPFEHEELRLQPHKLAFFLYRAREELRTSRPMQNPLGSLALATLLCAHAPSNIYRENCRKQLWELIDEICHDRQFFNPRDASGLACLLAHISFLLRKQERPELNILGNDGPSQMPQGHISILRNIRSMLDGYVNAEQLLVWPLIVDSFPNNRKRRRAFSIWASTCLHSPAVSCLHTNEDTSSAAALSRLMFYIKDPFEDEGLALTPTTKVLFLLRYALKQLEVHDVGDSALYSCAVALQLCTSASEIRYQKSYRATAWMMIDGIFACVLSRFLWVDDRKRQCLRDHISSLLRKHDHVDLKNDLGPNVLCFLKSRHESPARCEWALELREVLEDYTDLETVLS